MSEDKPRLPKLEMPKLSQEALDAWAVSMEVIGKVCREFGEAVVAAYPSVTQLMAEAVKSTERAYEARRAERTETS